MAATRIRVVCAIIERQGRLLAARRGPGMSHAGLWELPGGKVRPGERPSRALRREMQEEFRVRVRVHERFGVQVYDYPGFRIELAAYRCVLGRQQLRCVEHAQVRWLTRAGARRVRWTPADVPLVTAWHATKKRA
jgi:8-oxo-dGTP diphosphatase